MHASMEINSERASLQAVSWCRHVGQILEDCVPAQRDHPYLQALGVQRPWGYEFQGAQIGSVECTSAFIDRVVDSTGTCVNLFAAYRRNAGSAFETIFIPGHPLAGCYTPLGFEPDGEVVVVSDYESGVAVRRSTGSFVAVTHFDANLRAVAKVLAARYPGAKLTIASHYRRDEDKPRIARLLLDAAEATDASIAVPKGALQVYRTFAELESFEGERGLTLAIRGANDLAAIRATAAASMPEAVIWPTRVHLGAVIDQLIEFLRRYTAANEAQYVAIALWILCTHFTRQFDTAPILAVLSLTRRSGKTRTLRIIEQFVRCPDKLIDVSLAALYEACSEDRTLLIDEADQFLEKRELLQVLNGGHTRSGGKVRRAGGRVFDVFGFKLISGIGDLPTTLMDRSVCIHLVRKSSANNLPALDETAHMEAAALRSMIEAVQEDECRAVAMAAPLPPNLGNDRAVDNWVPLLKVAFVAGPEWLGAGSRAARALTADDDGLPSTVEEFICDLVKIFNADSRDFIPTEDLLQALTADTERPWATFVRGRALQNRDLASLMRQARVPVGEQHNDGTQNRRGYFRKHVQHLIDGYGS